MNDSLFKDEILKCEERFYEVKGLPGGEYDSQAVKYDKLVSYWLYNKIMWGNSPKNYSDFAKESLKNSSRGIIADIGCGALSFTSSAYANLQEEIFLCDLSAEMLKIGKIRIDEKTNNPSSIHFLRADAMNMPFRDESIQTVFSFGFLHVMENPSGLIQEFNRILKPDGSLYVSSLCTDRKFSARYLHLLQKKGHVANPMSSDEIGTIITKNGFQIKTKRVIGGMSYFIASKLKR